MSVRRWINHIQYGSWDSCASSEAPDPKAAVAIDASVSLGALGLTPEQQELVKSRMFLCGRYRGFGLGALIVGYMLINISAPIYNHGF